MKYVCVKSILLDEFQADCLPSGFQIKVEEGTVWHNAEDNIIGGEIHLECESEQSGVSWIEIDKTILSDSFIPLSDDVDLLKGENKEVVKAIITLVQHEVTPEMYERWFNEEKERSQTEEFYDPINTQN